MWNLKFSGIKLAEGRSETLDKQSSGDVEEVGDQPYEAPA
jgi:hypothetical protein